MCVYIFISKVGSRYTIRTNMLYAKHWWMCIFLGGKVGWSWKTLICRKRKQNGEMLLQLFFVIVSTRRSSSCCSPPPTLPATSVLHWQRSADFACHVACILICRLVSRNCRSLFAGCGGLLYDSGHRNQHFPSVQLEFLISHSIPESTIISKVNALDWWKWSPSFCPQHPFNPYPTAFPYENGMVLHFYQQQESSTTKTVHKVINKRLKTYV